MQQFEDRLRWALRRTGPVPSISKEVALARVARARRRRNLVAGLSALATCALALVVIVPLTNNGGLPVGQGPQLVHSGRLTNVVFTDQQHGYVAQERCSELHPNELLPNPQGTPDIQRECQYQLLATADAGATWQERTLPGPPAHKDAGVEIVFGHSLMLWVPAPGTLAVGSRNRRYWTTTDGGIMWQESPSPYDLGPPGSFGTFGLDDRHVFLASPPSGDVGEGNSMFPASDGSFWLECFKSLCVQVTRDQGQTWQTLSLPYSGPQQGVPGANWVATADGQTVYASVSTYQVNSTLIRSVDGGLTWQPVPGVTVPGRTGSGIALPNGDVIMTMATEAGGVLRLRAGGTALEPVAGAPPHANVLYRTGGWLVAARAEDGGDQPELNSLASVSPDNGTTWIAVPAP